MHKHGPPNKGGARTSIAPTAAKPTTQPQPQPSQQTTTTRTKHHHRGRRAPKQHGPRTNTARPTKRGATNQCSTLHQGGGARTNTAPTPARQTPQTTNTRQRRLYSGGGNSKPTKQAEHPAGYNTTKQNPNTPTQHAPPRGGPRTNTARPNRGGGTHQHNTNPGQANTTDNQHPTTPAVRRRRQRQHQQNKPSIQPDTTPRTEAQTRRHSTPHQEGGHAQTRHARTRGGGGTHQHSTNPGQANNTTATTTHPTHDDNPNQTPPPRQTGTNTARPTKRGATNQRSTLHQGGGHAPTQHQPWSGKHHRQPTLDNAGRTAAEATAHEQNKPSIQPATTPRSKARTRRHSTPHQGGGHAQTRHAPTGGGGDAPAQHQPGQANTKDNQHRTTPAVRRRRQRRTNKTSRASSRLQHHEPEPEHADTARPTKEGGQAQTWHALTGGGGHAPAQHQPRPGKHHGQSTPDNAGRTAAKTMANRQNKPSIQPDTTPRTEIQTRRHSTPHHEGGHAQTRHARTRGGGARTSTAPTPAKPKTQPQPQTTQQTTTTQTKHHHRGRRAPIQHGPRTNTARPTKRGATNQDSTLHQGGGGTHQHSTNPGQANTTDNQHPTTPAVWRWRQQRTNKTSRASSRQQHHKPKPEHADTARPTKRGATHKHGTPQQGRGHAPAQHQPWPSQQRKPQPQPTQQMTTTQTKHPPTTHHNRMHRHSTPHREGGHAPTQHAPP